MVSAVAPPASGDVCAEMTRSPLWMIAVPDSRTSPPVSSSGNLGKLNPLPPIPGTHDGAVNDSLPTLPFHSRAIRLNAALKGAAMISARLMNALLILPGKPRMNETAAPTPEMIRAPSRLNQSMTREITAIQPLKLSTTRFLTQMTIETRNWKYATMKSITGLFTCAPTQFQAMAIAVVMTAHAS